LKFNQPDERTQGPSHDPIIERFNGTLKILMYKKFTKNGNQIWNESCINEIQPQLCRMVIVNFDKRVRMCQQSRGPYSMYFIIQ